MEINIWTVFIAALITALMTGLGALPFLFVRKVDQKVQRLSNALACGLMLAASYGLIAEAVVHSPLRMVIGAGLGLFAIMMSKRCLGQNEERQFAGLVQGNAVKAILILGIMTAHSFAEGIGVGVSFGDSDTLGIFIATAIALHNVPEGLAISLILIPRGVSVPKAAWWSIFSSLPQPLMAVPAYLFVQVFRPFLPVGLGLAAGAMIWMVFAELIAEAFGTESDSAVGLTTTLAFLAMMAFQLLVLQ